MGKMEHMKTLHVAGKPYFDPLHKPIQATFKALVALGLIAVASTEIAFATQVDHATGKIFASITLICSLLAVSLFVYIYRVERRCAGYACKDYSLKTIDDIQFLASLRLEGYPRTQGSNPITCNLSPVR
ncbi:hypothetical protein CYMTET_34779, partial [Cymbomonas tetramitiformis]